MEIIKLIWELVINAIKDTPWWAWLLLIVVIAARVYQNRTVWGGKYLWIPPFLKRNNYCTDSKDKETAFLERETEKKNKIIKEALLKQGYTSEEIENIKEKSLGLANDLINKYERKD